MPIAVQPADRLAHAQVAGDDPRPAQRPRQEPLGAPAADAGQPRQVGDELLVVHALEVGAAQLAGRCGARGRDDRARLRVRELQCPQILDARCRQRLRDRARERSRSPISQPARRSAARGAGGSPLAKAQVDLLRADRSDERMERIRIQDGHETRVALGENRAQPRPATHEIRDRVGLGHERCGYRGRRDRRLVGTCGESGVRRSVGVGGTSIANGSGGLSEEARIVRTSVVPSKRSIRSSPCDPGERGSTARRSVAKAGHRLRRFEDLAGSRLSTLAPRAAKEPGCAPGSGVVFRRSSSGAA